MDGGALAWVGEEVWAVWAGEVDIAAEIYIEVADRTNSVRHFFQYAGRSRPLLVADFCELDFCCTLFVEGLA